MIVNEAKFHVVNRCRRYIPPNIPGITTCEISTLNLFETSSFGSPSCFILNGRSPIQYKYVV